MRGKPARSASFVSPNLCAAKTIAVSVGSPICVAVPSGAKVTVPSQQSAAVRTSVRAAASPESTAPAAPSRYAFCSVMRFCVSVPVLSEQITEALPSVSTAGRRRMIAFFFTMRCTPIESTMVTIAGRPSGIAETASETAVIKISRTLMPFKRPTTKMTAHAPSATKPRLLPSDASFRCSGVCVSASPESRPAILPISVCMPVAVMTAVAVP